MGAPTVNPPPGTGYVPFNIDNSRIPPEGPRAVRIPMDFSTVGAYVVDLTSLTQGQPAPAMSYVQTVFIDNSNNANGLKIVTDTLQQPVIIPAQSQAYLPVLQPNNPKLYVSTNAAADLTVTIYALNFPVSPAVWSTVQTGGVVSGGKLQVQDAILDALVGNYHGAGNALAVSDLSAAQGSTPFSEISAAAVMNLSLSASPCVLDSLQGFANVDVPAYVKVYDDASAVTPGTGTPVWRGLIPGNNSSGNSQGAGFVAGLPRGLKLANGLQIVVTLGIADSDATALTLNNYILSGTYHT